MADQELLTTIAVTLATKTAEGLAAGGRDRWRASVGDGDAELAALTTQITTGQAHTSFENGTMDDATAGPRIRDLRHRLTQLRARHAQLADRLQRCRLLRGVLGRPGRERGGAGRDRKSVV